MSCAGGSCSATLHTVCFQAAVVQQQLLPVLLCDHAQGITPRFSLTEPVGSHDTHRQANRQGCLVAALAAAGRLSQEGQC